MAKRDYYEVLGVAEKATPADIKKAYRRLAKDNHPDAHPGDRQAEARFKEASEAYSVLGDAKKRQQYDQMRRLGFGGPGTGPGFNGQDIGIDLSDLFGGFPRGQQNRTSKSGAFNLDDLFGFGGLGDIFSQIFERDNGYNHGGPSGLRGRDIHATLEIPFETAALGGTTVFVINKEGPCSDCSGSGIKGGGQAQACPECQGAGMVSKIQGGFAVSRPCPRCLGKGTLVTNPCHRCRGSGRTKGEKTYSLNIQPGTSDGKKMRLRGEGSPGDGGAPAGHLIITINVAKHGFFSLAGPDVHCEVPISRQQARTGTKIKVKTIHGNSVKITVPPDSPAGKTFRIKGMGAKNGETAGDQYVKIKVS